MGLFSSESLAIKKSWHGSCLQEYERHFYDCSFFLPRETQAHFGGPFFRPSVSSEQVPLIHTHTGELGPKIFLNGGKNEFTGPKFGMVIGPIH